MTITLLNGIDEDDEGCNACWWRMIGGRTIGWAVIVWIEGFGLVDEDDGRRTMDGGLPDIEIILIIWSTIALFLR